MKKIVTNLVVGFSAVLMLLVVSGAVNAQRRFEKRDVERFLRNVEQRSEVFAKQFDKSLDNSRLDGSRREDELNRKARELRSAVKDLRKDFDRRDNWLENKDNVRRCVDIASEINVAMKRNRFGAATESNWAALRRDLNTLARAYDLPGIGTGRR